MTDILKHVSVILDSIEGLVQERDTLTKQVEELTYQLNRMTGLNKNARLFLERAEAENAELKQEIAGYESVCDGMRDRSKVLHALLKKKDAQIEELIKGGKHES